MIGKHKHEITRLNQGDHAYDDQHKIHLLWEDYKTSMMFWYTLWCMTQGLCIFISNGSAIDCSSKWKYNIIFNFLQISCWLHTFMHNHYNYLKKGMKPQKGHVWSTFGHGGSKVVCKCYSWPMVTLSFYTITWDLHHKMMKKCHL